MLEGHAERTAAGYYADAWGTAAVTDPESWAEDMTSTIAAIAQSCAAARFLASEDATSDLEAQESALEWSARLVELPFAMYVLCPWMLVVLIVLLYRRARSKRMQLLLPDGVPAIRTAHLDSEWQYYSAAETICYNDCVRSLEERSRQRFVRSCNAIHLHVPIGRVSNICLRFAWKVFPCLPGRRLCIISCLMKRIDEMN